MDTVYYRMKWSWDVILVSALSLCAIIGGLVVFLVSEHGAWVYVAAALIVATLLAVALYMPYGMGCSTDGVFVRRIKGTLLIPYNEIRHISTMGSFDMMQLRVLGSGGFLGYYGIFQNQKIGRYVLYASQREGLLLIETARKKYVVSCPAPDDFIACCNRHRSNALQV